MIEVGLVGLDEETLIALATAAAKGPANSGPKVTAANRTFFPDGSFLFAKVDEFGSGDKR